MAQSLALAFDILARDKGATRTFNRVGDSAERAGRRGKSFGSMFKKCLAVAGGALAAVGLAKGIGELGQFLGDAIGEAREAQKVGKTTAQIIKATGGASKVSAKQVSDLAEAISVKAGVDDEAIQSGANLLLTFKKVRNEAGKGGAVFDRATKAAVDLSAAGFGSIEGASKMLGKALNDPVKGITALSRAGVTFTDQQKKQIKTLMASGKTLEAQKIILGEVESQVGGVASASASMGDKVKVAWDNFKERIGTAVLPILDKLGAWFLAKGLPLLERFAGWIETKAIPALGRLGGWIQANLMPQVRAFTSWITGTAIPALGRFGDWFTEKVLPRIMELREWLMNKLWPALEEGYQKVLPAIKSAIDTVSGGLKGGNVDWKALGKIITDKVIPFLTIVARSVLPVVAANLRTLIEGVKVAWKVFQTWMGIVGQVANKLLGAFAGITRGFASMLRALSNVPGFGWARDAANKMDAAANQADALGRAIRGIPSSKTVDIYVRTRQTGRITLPDGSKVNVGQRAKGGPVRKGMPYAVGDNPDGSWNKTTELFIPAQSGRILNQRQMASASVASTTATADSSRQSVLVQFVTPSMKVLAEGVLEVQGRVVSGGVTTVGQS